MNYYTAIGLQIDLADIYIILNYLKLLIPLE